MKVVNLPPSSLEAIFPESISVHRLYFIEQNVNNIKLEGFISACGITELRNIALHREGIINQHETPAGCHESQVPRLLYERLFQF